MLAWSFYAFSYGLWLQNIFLVMLLTKYFFILFYKHFSILLCRLHSKSSCNLYFSFCHVAHSLYMPHMYSLDICLRHFTLCTGEVITHVLLQYKIADIGNCFIEVDQSFFISFYYVQLQNLVWMLILCKYNTLQL